MQQVYSHRFANGLTLLAERMEHVRSAAFTFLVPAGCSRETPENAGVGGLLTELMTRGAGARDSRELTTALDNLGLDRGESVGNTHMHFRGATLATNLSAALDIYADILLRPHLPEDELDPVRALALEDVRALEDEPGTMMMLELYRCHYPAPLSNDYRGTIESLSRLKMDDVRAYYRKHVRADGAILAVAGNIEWQPLREQVGRLFGDWNPGRDEPLTLRPETKRTAHITRDKEQTQIGVAFQSVPVPDPDYYAAIGAVNVLSGDMSCRLFTEIREKEGLCYSVGASYQTFKDRASIIGYAGSRPDLAQRTLDLMLREFRRLSEGIAEEEVARVRVSLKTGQIMKQESSGARAAALASDWFYLGRVRTLDEIRAAIESITIDSILGYLRHHPPGDFTVVTLGPKALEVKTN